MYGYIYMTINTINGKYYIGKHKSNAYDPEYYGSGIALKRAMEKYGKDSFVNSLLDSADSLEELNEKEKQFIKVFNAQRFGYNIAPGGDGGEVWGDPSNHPSLGKHGLQGEQNPMYGKKLSDEAKKRIRQSLKGRRRITKDGKWKSVYPDEVEKWIEDGWKCPSLEEKKKKKKENKMYKKRTPRKGWHHTEESKKKISKSNLKAKGKPEYRKKRSVISKEVWDKMPEDKREAFKEKRRLIQTGKKPSEETKKKLSESLKKGYKEGRYKSRKGMIPWNKGLKVSEEQRKILGDICRGRIHITNGEINKMIYPEDFIEWEQKGFRKGRTIKKEGKNNA